MMLKHHAQVSKLLPDYTCFGDQLKDDERPYNKLYGFKLEYSTKPMSKHKFNDYISVKSRYVYTLKAD